jgi:transcriptional regulator with XRE-family HTH domain
MATLAENLKSLREKNRWSQQHLANLVNISQSRISEIENGRVVSPRISRLQNLATALGVSQGELCGESLPNLTPP